VKPAEDPLIGTRIREYQILEVIGKGGMGAVYRARHIYLDEDRALKMIQGRLAGDSDFVDRFIREAKILTRLRHPNLVQLHEFGTLREDTFFMVMEMIVGESVAQRMDRLQNIPVPDAIRIALDVARGLSSAHQKGVVHRDISPGNIILCKDVDGSDFTKVIDFGIAKPNADAITRHFTLTNHFIGKPEYCSPEQCGTLKDGEVIDARSDIYSLGVTLYYMIAGRLPFHSRTPYGYLQKHINESPRPLSQVVSFPIPESLDRLILKALAKQRENRQASMEELIRDLHKCAAPGSRKRSTSPDTGPVSLTEPQPGEVFARRYLIETNLGAGSTGTVYKAKDELLKIPIALKIITENIARDEGVIERFRREAILARRVTHPNMCRIFDVGEYHGFHYVSMEYIEGESLGDILKTRGSMNPVSGLPLIVQVLTALHEAHKAGVIHRGLRPRSILIDRHQKAFILDFGMSISQDVRRVTNTGSLVGTPHYMAPEQFKGKNIDHRSDLYAVGVIMYEMFTGSLPFDAETPVDMILAHMNLSPSRPSEVVPDFPPEIERIIMKALQKEPKDRYQSAREILHDIEPFVGTAGEAPADRKVDSGADARFISAKRLNALVKNYPDDAHWKTLLDTAVKTEVRRAISLLKKKNLIRARMLAEKLNRYDALGEKAREHVRKLHDSVRLEIEKAAGEYLREAEELIESKKFQKAASCLESARNLQPNDPRIETITKKLQKLQQRRVEKNVTQQIEEVRKLIAENMEQEALTLAEEIVNENPLSRTAKLLHNQILNKTQLDERRIEIQAHVKTALGPLAKVNFSMALSNLTNLSGEVKELDFANEITRIRSTIKFVSAAFATGSYGTIPGTIRQLIASDRYEWIKPNADILGKLIEIATAKDAKVRERFQATFSNAMSAYDESRWEEAIQLWKEAQRYQPADPTVADWIAEAERRKQGLAHSATVDQPPDSVQSNLAEALRYWEQKEYEKALTKVGVVLLRQPLLPAALKLRTEIQEAYCSDLVHKADARSVKKEWGPAITLLERAASILPSEAAIQRRLEENRKQFRQLHANAYQSDTGTDHLTILERLKSALDRGRNYSQKAEWTEALKAYKEAALISSFPELQKRIDEIEQRLLGQRRKASS